MFSIIVALLAVAILIYSLWAIFTPQGKAFVKKIKAEQEEEKRQKQLNKNKPSNIDTTQTWIIYQKEDGTTSHRHINVFEIEGDFDLYCRAFDLEKNGERTFKLSRITALGHNKGSKQYTNQDDILRLLQKNELQNNDKKYLLEYTNNDDETKTNYIEVVALKQAKKGHWYLSAKVHDIGVLSYRIDRMLSLDNGHQVIMGYDNILNELDKFKEI